MGTRSIAALVVLAASAAAGPVEDAADAVHKAFAAGTDLEALASKDNPDPWLVADELCARGQHDAAEAFAKAAPRVDVEALPAYVAKQRQVMDDAKRRARLAAAGAPFAARKFKEMLEALGPAEVPPGADVVGVRLACARGLALSGLVRLEDSAAAWLAAGETAARMGWLARAAWAYDAAGLVALRGSAVPAARAAWERLLAIWERRSNRAGVARTLGNIGITFSRLGEYAKALAIYERALATQEALPDKVGAARTLNNIGLVHMDLGDYTSGLEYLGRALAAKDALGDKRGAARTLINIGNVHRSLGDHAKALAIYERALSTLEAHGDKEGVATALGNIGTCYRHLGDYAKALSFTERALAAMTAWGDKAGAAGVLHSIGNIYIDLGDRAKALASFERALAARKALGDKVGAASTLGGIGVVHHKFGDCTKALSFYERALAVQTVIGDKAGAAAMLGNIGLVHHSAGDYARALSFMDRARSAMTALGDNAGAATALGNIGLVHYSLGDYAQSLSTNQRALAAMAALGDKAGAVRTLGLIALAHAARGDGTRAAEAARRGVRLLPLLVGGLGDAQAATAREQSSGLFVSGVRAGVGLEDPAEVLFFLESGRAGSLLEALGNRKRLSGFVIPPALRAVETRARDRERVALRHYRRALDRGEDIKDLWQDVEAARGGILDVVQRIRREAKAQADLVYPEAASLADVQGALGGDEALVLYALLNEEAYALVVMAKQARIVALGATVKITQAAEALQRAVSRPDERGVAVPPHESFRYLEKRLRKLAVAPLGLKAKRVLVSPDGPLCYVPFAVLTDAEVAYVPSATTYRLLRDQRAEPGVKVLALGDPEYAELARLPASGKEAEAVGDVVLLGKQATLPGLRDALGGQKRWHAVHLACHALIDPERPVLSALALTGGSLRCLDVYRMRIPADLVVLSACETAKGKVYRTEGVVGWTRAFLFAGSSRVLVSLWKVDDEATRVLMEAFYAMWKHEDAATALASAQAAVRAHEKWRHPYFWAAWQLWGLAK